MRTIYGTSSGIALAAGFVFFWSGACSSSDPPKAASNSGGKSSAGGTGSGGRPTTGGRDASDGAPASGGTDSGPASGGAPSGGAPSGGAGGSGGVSSGGSAGSDSGSGGAIVKVECVAPTRNATIGNPCPGTAPPALKLTPIVTGLNYPVFVTQAPGDAERLYVVEQTGLIRTVKDGAIEATPFLNIKSVLGSSLSGEQGFLGLAFAPNFETSRRFFIKYSGKTGNGKHVIAEYKVGSDGLADPGSARIILEFNHLNSQGNHNGGMVAFGPDGCLYVAVGDGGGQDDPTETGQDPSDYFASILRLDVDNFPSPAPGNMSSPANAHLWSYGLRNPWRFSFDSANGDLYIGDVGGGAWEEVDVEPRGTMGRNYGWRITEGAHCRDRGTTCDQSGKTLPAAEYVNPSGSDDSYAVAGGYVYRGSNIPGMVGRYVYAETFRRKFYSFVYKGETDGKPEICDAADLTGLNAAGDVVSFGQDLAGELYVVSYSPGTIARIDPAD